MKTVILRFTAILLAAVLPVCSACKKEEKQTKDAVLTQSVPAALEIDFSNTLVARIPSNSVGFLKWDGGHPAYEKLLNSPWGGKRQDSMSNLLQGANPQVAQIYSILDKVGLAPNDNDTWRKVFSEAVFFLSPPSNGGEFGFGLVFKSKNISMTEKLKSIKAELGQNSIAVKELNAEGASGISFDVPTQGRDGTGHQTVFFAAKNEMAVLGSSQDVLDTVLRSKGDTVPTVAKSANLPKALRGAPPERDRFAVGYFDLQELFAHAGTTPQGVELKKFQSEKFPLQGIGVALGMSDTPQTFIQATYDSKTGSPSMLSNLRNSQSPVMLAAVPSKPLLFVSIDGQSLRRARDSIAASTPPEQQQLFAQLAFMDNLNRAGITARMAPVGQSILPVPDMMIILDTPNVIQAKDGIEKMIDTLAQASPTTQGMKWSDHDVDGKTKIRAMMSPLGLGVFLVATDKLVLISSAEAPLRAALQGQEKDSFTKNLSDRAQTVLSKQPNVGTVYVNFEEVGLFMENMGGVLSMYAPQNQNTNKLLEQQNIDSMKKMGAIVGTVTLDEDAIGFRTFYQPPAAVSKG